MMIEALAQWVDTPIHVVLSVAAQDASFCLGLTDELGCGTRSLYYEVEVVERGVRGAEPSFARHRKNEWSTTSRR